MNFIRKIPKWLTEPTLLHGVAIGISLSILLAMVWQLSLARTFSAMLLAISFLMVLGALLGHYFYKRQRTAIESESLKDLSRISTLMIDSLNESESARRNRMLEDLAPDFFKSLTPAIGSCLGLVARFFAIGRLFALLGVVVTFAVFLATYMQVERLSEQNSLIKLQSLSAHQQISLSMRNEINQVRSLAILAAELRDIYKRLSNSIRSAKQSCIKVHSPIREVIDSLIKERNKTYSAEEQCLRSISNILVERSSNMDANRLLNQQVTGSSYRLSVFSRDLTEQFTTQFSSLCNSEPQLTADVGKRWTALNEFESISKEIVDALDGSIDEDVIYLSGPPELSAMVGIQKFLTQVDEEATTINELVFVIFDILSMVESYLDEQRQACFQRANQLGNNLDRIDTQYEKLLNEQKKN